MNDLINNFDGDIEELNKKYFNIVENIGFGSGNKNEFLIILDYTIKHLENKYSELSSEEKAYLTTLIYKLYKGEKDFNVEKSIEDYMSFYKENYLNYVDEALSVSRFDLDNAFIDFFIKNL